MPESATGKGAEQVRASVDSAEEHEPAHPFKLIPFNEISVPTSANYLVKDLLPAEGLACTWGEPKCGKSFWMLDLSLHVALGWDYRGHRVRKESVVYVACEGERGLGARVEAWRQHNLAEESGPIPFFLVATRLDLIAECDTLIECIRAQSPRPGLIIIDTVNRSLAGSESKDEDMGAYIKACDALREAFDALIMLIHHCGWDASRLRGSRSLPGALDAEISVERNETGSIICRLRHMKDGLEGEELVSKLDVVEIVRDERDEEDDPITSCVIVPTDDDASATARRAKLTGKARLAFNELVQAMADDGEKAPVSSRIPGQNRVVRLELWRANCEGAGVWDRTKPDNFKRQFRRMRDNLINRGIIGFWNDLVWIVGQTGQGTDNADCPALDA